MNWSQRMQARMIALVVAALLGTCMVAFLALAGYLALLEVVRPVIAALITAGCLLLTALIVLLVTRVATARRSRRRRSRGQRRRTDANPLDGLEEVLEDYADPVLGDWVRRNPDRAALATVLLGVAAGYSSSVRRALQDLYNHYAESESRRRERD